MIAPNDGSRALYILTIGLLPEEEEYFQNLVLKKGGEFKKAHDELDVWNQARRANFDVFVVGQCEHIEIPSYLVWLLKGIASQANIIVIYSNITAEERKRLENTECVHVLQRYYENQHIKLVAC